MLTENAPGVWRGRLPGLYGVILLPTSQLGQQLRREERRKDETHHTMNFLAATRITTSKRKQVKEALERETQWSTPYQILWDGGLNPEPHRVASMCSCNDLK